MKIIKLLQKNYKFLKICGEGSSSTIYKLQNYKNNKYYTLKEERSERSEESESSSTNILITALYLKNHKNIRKYHYLGNTNTSILKHGQEPELFGVKYIYYLSKYYNYTLRDIIEIRNKNYFSTLYSRFITRKENFLCHKNMKINQINALKIFNKIVKGTVFLHEQNKLHCDLKPENIFLSKFSSKDVVIGDFDLMKDLNSVKIDIKECVGTVLYVAPETKYGMYVCKSDVYALGLIYFELLWPMKTQMERIMNFENLRYFNKLPNMFVEQYPKEAAIIGECMQHNVNERISCENLYIKMYDLFKSLYKSR